MSRWGGKERRSESPDSDYFQQAPCYQLGIEQGKEGASWMSSTRMTMRAKANSHVTNAEILFQYFNFHGRWKIRGFGVSGAGGSYGHCRTATHSHEYGVLTHIEAWPTTASMQTRLEQSESG